MNSPDYSKGVMLALYPDADKAKELALDKEGAEKAETLHVTLAFIGERGEDGVPDKDYWAELHDAAKEVAKRHPPQDAGINGLGQFPEGDNGTPYVGIIGSHTIHPLQQDLVNTLKGKGVEASDKFPFVPHMTFAYLQDGEEFPNHLDRQDLTFNHLVVKNGDVTHKFEFEGTPPPKQEPKEARNGSAGWSSKYATDTDYPVRVEMICGSNEVDKGHPGYWSGMTDEHWAHPGHERLQEACKKRGLGSFVEPSNQGGTWFSDAYAYAHGHQLDDLDAAITESGHPADDMTVYGPISDEHFQKAKQVADKHGMDFYDERPKTAQFQPAPTEGPMSDISDEEVNEHLRTQHGIPESETADSGKTPLEWHDALHSEKGDIDLFQPHWHYPGTFSEQHKPDHEYVGHIGEIGYSIAGCSCGWQSNVRSEQATNNAWQRHITVLDEGARREKAGEPHYVHPAPHTKRWGTAEFEPQHQKWMHGGCGDYARALHKQNPHLQFGIHVFDKPEEGEGWGDVVHVFTHDDDTAYDATGRHPLPYKFHNFHEWYGLGEGDVAGMLDAAYDDDDALEHWNQWHGRDKGFDIAKKGAWMDQVSRPYQDEAIADPNDSIEPVMPPLYQGNYGVWPDDMVEENLRTTHPVDVFSGPKTGKTANMYVRKWPGETFHIWQEHKGDTTSACGEPLPTESGREWWIDKPDEDDVCHKCESVVMEEGIADSHRERQEMIDESKREYAERHPEPKVAGWKK